MSGFCIDAMNQQEFAQLLAKAVEDLPQEFLTRLENVDVVVQEYPTLAQLRRTGLRRDETLLGLYEGIPQTKRGSHYGMVLPDKITIFQKPIEANCRSDAELYTEVSRVLKHEIAHHFGISDARLREIEKG
ncbi:metallopeptidase family protein [Chloroflexota bacterium]